MSQTRWTDLAMFFFEREVAEKFNFDMTLLARKVNA